MSRFRVFGVLVATVVASAAMGNTADAAEAATCFGVHATIVGTPGNDTIAGTDGADVIAAGDGSDRIRSGGGRDLVCAGGGDDVAWGGKGDDRIRGGGGDDNLAGFFGDDQLFGGGGDDQLVLDPGDDIVDGGAGTNMLLVLGHQAGWNLNVNLALGAAAGRGSDRLANLRDLVVFDWAGSVTATGNTMDNLFEVHAGTALLRGRGGNDSLLSFESGDDRLYGGAGNDALLAGEGNDFLDGGAGTDYLNGEGGTDTCVHGENVESCP